MGGADAARSPDGLILGRYRPLTRLGSGGSGTVWRARDERAGVDVALKVVPREGNAGPRAEREASAGARLRHERCLRAFALARDSRHVYIAYEYVPGRTLRDVLRERDLGDEEAIEVAAQILEALAHAHAHGIVHRDVKPSNVLLADGEEVSVRLLDFGLALVREDETLTAAGDVPGTLAYIPPERLRGGAATPAADVWAVGVLLWEALAGRHPFFGVSLAGTAKQIEKGAPPLAQARPDLPAELTRLVDQALAPDPKARPAAAKLAKALRRRAAASAPRRRPRMPGCTLSLGRLGKSRAALRSGAAAAAAGIYAGFGGSILPFYPHGGAAALAAAAAVVALVRARAGAALALAAPVLPLGNLALGLAVVYAAAATAALAVGWRRPREALLFVAGPLLASVGALPLLPLVLAPASSSAARRAYLAGVGVLAAAAFDALPGAGPALAGDSGAVTVSSDVAEGLASRPELLLQAAVLAGAAAALPLLRGRGPWTATGFAAAFVTAALLAAPEAATGPAVAAAWAAWAWLVLPRGTLRVPPEPRRLRLSSPG